MEKIYGYKTEEVIGLAKFLKGRSGNLTQTFLEYARRAGKAPGTVRNMYYALAKFSSKNSEFCEKYLDGKPLGVKKNENFTDEQARTLILKVLQGKKQGKSVRQTIFEMANGNATVALRYQNKYRNALKNDFTLVEEISKGVSDEPIVRKRKSVVSDGEYAKLKVEIDGLVDRICEKLKRENGALKDRIYLLELENVRLKGQVMIDGGAKYALTRVDVKKDKKALN